MPAAAADVRVGVGGVLLLPGARVVVLRGVGVGVGLLRVVRAVLGLRPLGLLGGGVDAVLAGLVGHRLRLVDRVAVGRIGVRRLAVRVQGGRRRPAPSYWRSLTSRTGSAGRAPLRAALRRRLAPGLPPSAQPVEKPLRKESVTYVWPTAKVSTPRTITRTDGQQDAEDHAEESGEGQQPPAQPRLVLEQHLPQQPQRDDPERDVEDRPAHVRPSSPAPGAAVPRPGPVFGYACWCRPRFS